VHVKCVKSLNVSFFVCVALVFNLLHVVILCVAGCINSSYSIWKSNVCSSVFVYEKHAGFCGKRTSIFYGFLGLLGRSCYDCSCYELLPITSLLQIWSWPCSCCINFITTNSLTNCENCSCYQLHCRNLTCNNFITTMLLQKKLWNWSPALLASWLESGFFNVF